MLVGRADDGKQAAHISASTMVCCGVVSCSQAHISASSLGATGTFGWIKSSRQQRTRGELLGGEKP